jgi:hypothetical protein
MAMMVNDFSFFFFCLRRKRMLEMQAEASKEKYGDLTEISKPDFVREVTEASKECYVVVHLYQD